MECAEAAQGFFVLLLSVFIAFQGLAFAVYQGGIQRGRSPDGLLLQAVINLLAGSILWYSVGFSLSFSASMKGFIGDLDHAFFLGVSQSNCSSPMSMSPELLTAGFEMTMALMGPVMMTAVWASHINALGAVVLYFTWPIFVYYPLTHWIRGHGWLADNFQIVDDAGALTMHTAAGASALVFTKVFKTSVQEVSQACHQLSSHQCIGHISGDLMLLLGALMTIPGWYGFNMGALVLRTDPDVTVLSLLNCHISVCTSASCWAIFLCITKKKCRFADILPGVTVGVVAVSSAPGSMPMWAVLLTGLFAGTTSSILLWIVKRHRPLWTTRGGHDVTFVHGIPGIISSIAAGLFAKPRLSYHSADSHNSSAKQFGVQLLGVLVTVFWSTLCTYLLIWFIRFTVGFNHSDSDDMTCDAMESSGLSSRDQITLREELFQAVSQGNIEELERLSADNAQHLSIQDWDKSTLLHRASSLDQLQCVKFLLRPPGVDIHARDRWNSTPLTEAMRNRNDRVVKYLLRHGASWFEDGAGDLLCSAVKRHDLDELERLTSLAVDVNAPSMDGTTALHMAASLGSRGVVQYLIDQGADVNAVDSWGNTPLNYSDMHEHRAVSQLLETLGGRRASHHYSTYEICEVASKGNLQMLRHMVHNGATVCYKDFNRRTPLHVSAAEGHLDVVKFLLLQPGIDVNAKDRNGFTPLLDAIVNCHRSVAEYLKSHAGTVDECKLAELVTEAVKTGDTKALKRLLRWSGHVNICNYDGCTALHVAAACNRPNVISVLLKQGADANLINRFGQTPLQVAISCQNFAVEKELSKFMKLSKAVLVADDSPPTSCYDVHVRRRGRKHKTEPSYDYTKSSSWSSADNPLDIRRQIDMSSTSTDCNTAGSNVNLAMAEVHKVDPQKTFKIPTQQPTFLQIQPVSGLTLKEREMRGGTPEYV